MTIHQLPGLGLAEETPAPHPVQRIPRAVHPVDGKRRPTDPGHVLTWRQFARDVYPLDREGHTVRTGMVLALAPRAGTVWVVPFEPAPGEGYAVIVGQVTADSAADAIRVVGSVGDELSMDGWQRPHTLPRAVLRIDRYTVLGGGEYHVEMLHADPSCKHLQPFEGEDVARGAPEPVEECYVFDGGLHPWSRRPIARTAVSNIPGMARYVDLCRTCLPGMGRQHAAR